MESLLCKITVTTVCLGLVLPAALADPAPDLLTAETLARRKLTRFTVGHPDHSQCWTRHGVDGFYSVVDAHNHFRPFGGPPVPWDTYIDWMRSHGIIFSTMLGIGQQLIPRSSSAKACCYYLHCANFEFPVVPDPKNDKLNAQDYNNRYQGQPLEEEMHLTLSATFPNLQTPKNNSRILGQLQSQFPNAFKWSGEINVFKHALAANGFFQDGERVSEAVINAGKLDGFFRQMETKQWPTTLHSDLGCDQYDAVRPYWRGKGEAPDCVVPEGEKRLARQNHQWWKDFLGNFYRGFFDSTNAPKSNFKKIMHLKIWDTLLTRYPDMTVVWAHLGLSKELKTLHPKIHAFIIKKLMAKHPKLHADVSWDVLSKQLLMNYNPATHNVNDLHHNTHEDFDKEVEGSIVDTAAVEAQRQTLVEVWDRHKEMVNSTGSVSGPTHAMAIYLEMFHAYPDRFVTGTDFVSSLGPGDQFPGLKDLDKANGCMKDKKNHARQVTDTSSINMFLSDEAFSKIVLGGNYFKILRLTDQFAPPPVCGDSALPVEAVIGIGVGAAVLIIVAILVAVILLCCCRKTDDSAFIRVDGSGNAATSHV